MPLGCLAALGDSYPVIVVDDGSADQEAIRVTAEKHGARLRRRAVPGGPGPARNDGLALVTTPLVAFLDSDCVAGPDWITALDLLNVPHRLAPASVAPGSR